MHYANSIEFSHLPTYLDRACDYLPVVSTVTNLTDLFLKHIFLPNAGEQIQNSRYFVHIKDKSNLRSVLLLFPFIGNIAVGIFDFSTRRYNDKEYVLKAVKNFEETFFDKFSFLRRNHSFFDNTGNSLHKQSTLHHWIYKFFFPLNFASDNLKSDKEFMVECIEEDYYSYVVAGPAAWKDKELTRCAINQNVDETVKLMSREFFQDREVILETIYNNRSYFLLTKPDWLNDREFMIHLLKGFHHRIFKFIEQIKNEDYLQKIKKNNAVIRERMRDNPSEDYSILNKYKNDLPLMLDILQLELQYKHGWVPQLESIIDYILENVKDSYTFMYTLTHLSEDFVLFASSRLKKSKDFLLRLVKSGINLHELDPQFYNESDDRLRCLKSEDFEKRGLVRENFYIIDPDLRSDPEFILECMKQFPHYYKPMRYAPEALKDNPAFIFELLKIDISCVVFASERLKDNPEFMIQVVQEHGIKLFEIAPDKDNWAWHAWKKRSDYPTQTLVATSGLEKDQLYMISEQVYDNGDFILAAVTKDGLILKKYLDKLSELKDTDEERFSILSQVLNTQIVLAAIRQNPEVMQFIRDKKFRALLKPGVVFAIIVLLCDGYLRVRKNHDLLPSHFKAARFYKIASQLPLELQMVLVHRLFQQTRDTVPTAIAEWGFKKVVFAFENELELDVDSDSDSDSSSEDTSSDYSTTSYDSDASDDSASSLDSFAFDV